MRVAVAPGASAVRVAAVEDGEPYVLAEVAGPATPARVREVLVELLGPEPAAEVVVVRDAAAEPVLPGAVALHPACAALRGLAVGSAPAPGGGPWLVVDAGYSGTSITVVAADGRCTTRRCGPGGARLDEAVAAMLRVPGGAEVPVAVARQARESLSLLPAVSVCPPTGPPVRLGALEVRAELRPLLTETVAEAAGLAGAVAGARPVPVLLVGGLARTPLLAEMLDAAGIGPVTVAARPDAAAVLGALRTGPAAAPVSAGRSCPGSAAAEGDGSGPRWLPPPLPRRHRGAWAVVAVVAVVGAVVATALCTTPPQPAPAGDVVVQYGYAVRLPEGWVHAGGLPERRRTLLAPAARPDGSDVVTVERTTLGYDAVAEPERALADLRAAFDAAVAAGAPLAEFTEAARFAGRPVVTYRQGGPDGPVDWYVLRDVADQLSIGCRHTTVGADEVARACATVVGSARIG